MDAPIRAKRSYGALCDIEGCDRTHEAKGLCKAHYQRLLYGLPVDQPISPAPGHTVVQTPRTCDLPGCDRTHKSRGLCNRHHSAKLRRERSKRGG